MFWKLFKSRKKEATPPAWWKQWQTKSRVLGLRVSGWLERKTSGLSRGQVKFYSALVVLAFVSWNGWIIAQAIRHPAGTYMVQQIRMPSHLLAPTKKSGEAHRFRLWLDSLRTDSAGRKIYDAIRRERPGLLDSLRQLEKMYSQ